MPISFKAAGVEFKEPIVVKDFHHPTFPKNSSFKQLIETVNSRPIFSKGHWRQTLTRPKQRKFARIEKSDGNDLYDTDINDYEDQDLDDIKDEPGPSFDEQSTTERPYVYSTLYYDDFPLLSDDENIPDDHYKDQVFEIRIKIGT